MGGLDFWSYGQAKGVPIIQEPRLRNALAESFRIAGRPLSFENAFREPPAGDGRQPQRTVGIQVLEMPRWFVCQNPRCRALVRSDGLDLKGGRYRHQCEQKKGTESVPVRFVGACRRGHVQEFPWIYFAHRKAERQCPAPSLKLLEGATGELALRPAASVDILRPAHGRKGIPIQPPRQMHRRRRSQGSRDLRQFHRPRPDPKYRDGRPGRRPEPRNPPRPPMARSYRIWAGDEGVKAWVGVTDTDWYRFLSARPDLDEINFWKPSAGQAFRALQPGEPFLFKLRFPENAIVGGGY